MFVTHDQEEALSMSDRIAVMSGGKVLQVAPPRALYEQPNCREVADFIGTMNFFDGTVAARDDHAVTIEAGPLGSAAAAGRDSAGLRPPGGGAAGGAAAGEDPTVRHRAGGWNGRCEGTIGHLPPIWASAAISVSCRGP